MSNRIDVDRHGNVAVLTINDPGTRNALTVDSALEFIAACDELDRDCSVGATIVRGAERQFCAGAHRDVLALAGQDPAAEEAYNANGTIYGAFQRFGRLQMPTVAAIHGSAVGAGMNLALAADLRVVSESARLMSGFMRIGIHPGGGHITLMSRLIGKEAAAAMSLFSEEIDGRRAAELGFAWSAVAEDEVDTEAMRLASAAARDPDLARVVASSFRLQNQGSPLSWDAALASERAPQMWSLRRRELAKSGKGEA